MKSFLKTLAIIGAANASVKWDYKKNGSDWPSVDTSPDTNLCGTGSNQSPIDLKTNGWPMKDSNFDNFNKIYTDQTVDVQVTWNGHTSQVDISKEGQSTQTIHSQHAADEHDAGTTYNGVQFHFHAGSEHTVDGVRQDIEMHTVHLAVDKKSDFIAAAMGIMFSVDKPTPGVSANDVAIIDEFFDALNWDKISADHPLVEKVPYGKLMMMFDMRNRWTYKGSVTTPPCAQNVYWNVLRTVYPIKQKHLDMFKSQLARQEGLDNTGNWRVTLPLVKAHNPVVLFSNSGVGGPTNQAAAAVKNAAAGTTSGSASGSAAASTSAGGVTLQQQGTIIVQHQGYLSSGAPYPMPQQYYQPPVIQQAAAAPVATAQMGNQTVEIPSDFRVVIIFLAVAVFLLILVIVIGIFCQQFGRQQQYASVDAKGQYATQEMGQRNFN